MSSIIIEKVRRNIQTVGSSKGIIIPYTWLKDLEVNSGEEINLALMHSEKHGSIYIAAWKTNPNLEVKESL